MSEGRIEDRLLHYVGTVKSTKEGPGRLLKPACGQPEWILVTANASAVECLKCKRTRVYQQLIKEVVDADT